jgi:hypothetical protein
VFRRCLGVVFGNLGITCDSFVSTMCRSIDHSPLLNEKQAICLVAKKKYILPIEVRCRFSYERCNNIYHYNK